MNINSMGTHHNHMAHGHGHQVQHGHGHHKGPGGPERTQEMEGWRQQGVIRNLMEGHYKGVADIRLRMNFGDRLAKLESAQVAEVMAEPLEELADLEADLDALLALSGDLPEDSALSQAMADLSSKIDALSSTEGMSVEDAKGALEGLRTSLDTLLGEIQTYLDQAQAEPPVEEVPVVEPEVPAAEEAPPAEVAAQPEEVPQEETEPVEPPVEETPVAVTQEVVEEEVEEEPVEEVNPFLATLQDFMAKWLTAVSAPEEGTAAVEAALAVEQPAEEAGAFLTALEDFLADWQTDITEPVETVPAAGEVPAEEEPAVEEPAETEPTATAGSALLADIEDRLAQLDQIQVLPPLAGPPPNQGTAYFRFLAIYIEMGTAGEAAEPTGEEAAAQQSVDTVA